jgi:Recombination endonuclease VII
VIFLSDSKSGKNCKVCGDFKPLEDFYANPAGRQGRCPECKECTKARRKVWYQRNREREIARVGAWQRRNPEKLAAQRRQSTDVRARKYREWHLRKRFGLTIDVYGALLAAQDGTCAICSTPTENDSALHVDHDHETGRVRGLLCMRCNNALGLLRDDPEVLSNAVDYLHRLDPDGLGRLANARARELVGAGRG